jgi:hypothetical protein
MKMFSHKNLLNKSFLILLTFVGITIAAHSQSTNVRGFFVTNSDNIIGNAALETDLLTYAQSNGFNYLAMYDLSGLNWSSQTVKSNVANFIKKAKTQYGILQVGACTEIYAFHRDWIIPYNQGRSASNEKFDVLYFEFEFWVTSVISSYYCSLYLTPNGYNCDTAGAFAFAKNQFQQIDNAAAANGLISEIYFGWPNRGQMQQMAQIADRILLSAYRPTDVDVYSASKTRLSDIGSLGISKKVISIYSAEPAFMGTWLNTHPITQPYATLCTGFSAETGSWKQYIDLQGYHWFNFTYLPRTAILTATITAATSTSFCTGGSVVLSANSGTGFSYQWMKNSTNISGATNINYTATTAGVYTVKVTLGASSVTSSGVTVSVSAAIPTPTITAGGSLNLCNGSTVTLTSSSAPSYSWTSGQTTQSITVSTAGNYKVTATSGSCSAQSAQTTVTATTLATPTVTASGSTTFCPGGSVTLTSSVATTYSWSNGASTRSITVTTSGSYRVTVSSGGCSAQSAQTSVSATSLPTPTVTASGSTTFCPGGSVTLTSSSAPSYSWTNGASTQSITVSTSGNYRVTVTSGSCTAQSSITTVTATALPTPTVTASGATSFCAGGSVTLTSSSAPSYSWTNGASTQSITVSSAGNYRVTAISGSCTAQSVATNVSIVLPTTPTVTSSSGSLNICYGFPVTLSSSPATSYLWSNGATTPTISVSNAGTYRVTATTGNCTATSANAVTTVTLVLLPTITASGSMTFCTGGSVTLTSSTSPAYRWSNGATTQSITVTTPGNYQVTAVNGNCSTTAGHVSVAVVNNFPTPTITASGATGICPGSAVTLTASPATTYSWSNGANTRSIVVTSAGNYRVTGYAGASCFAQSAATPVTMLTAPATPTISASGSTILTSGQTVTLTSSVANSYVWSSGPTTRAITTGTAGTYRVTVAGSNGCTSVSAPIAVSANGCTPPAVPTISASGNTTLLPGQNVTLTSTTAAGYLWSNGATTRSITVSAAGVYTVRAYSASSCFTSSLPMNVYFIAARHMEELSNNLISLSAYPNPVSDVLNIVFNSNKESEYELKMIDLIGRQIRLQKINATEGENRVELNVNEYQNGIYLLYLSNEKEEKHIKIIVQ